MPKKSPFVSSYAIYKTSEEKYKIVFNANTPPPSLAYWNDQGKFLQTATFSSPQIAQVFRHNHLDMIDKKSLGYKAVPDSGIYEYGRVSEYPYE
jgi:hypothetical protein